MKTLDVALTNLNQYVCGKLNFVWLSLPCTEEEYEKALDRIEVSHGDKHYYYEGNESEELFISDYESDIFHDVGEYSNVWRLNKMASLVNELNDEQKEIIEVLLSESYELEDAISELDNICFYPDCENMAQLAMSVMESNGDLERIPKDLRDYIDYEAYGNMLETTCTFYACGTGYFEIA